MRTVTALRLSPTTSAMALLAVLSLAAVGCGSTLPPKELVDARAAYDTASKGPAAQQTPAELHTARQALDQAERLFNDEGDGQVTKDAAYVAIRKAQAADSMGRTAVLAKEKEAAEKDAQALEGDIHRKTQGELAKTKAELERERAALEKSREQLERERIAREEAEKKAAQALADLRKFAEVKSEARGTVITLSGGVLFVSNESTLSAGAMAKLAEVSDALIKSDPDSSITIEGHTDNQGQAKYNDELSQKRADAVRDYFVSRGIAKDRIKSNGLGAARPIAPNTSPEGRANNRRVEIIITPAKK